MPFPRNNIEFRQHSSLVLSHFKRAQSFLLSEVTADDRHVFSRTSKELLLQCFSIWSKWLMRVEDEFIRLEGQVVTEDTVERITHDLFERFMEFSNFAEKDDYFDPVFIEVWSKVFTPEIESDLKVLGYKLTGCMITDAYTYCVEDAKIIMNHHLFILQEIDCLLDKKVEDFLTVDRFDINLYSEVENSLSLNRLRVYQAHGLDDNIFIKSYIDENELAASRQVSHFFNSIISTLRQFVTITKIQ